MPAVGVAVVGVASAAAGGGEGEASVHHDTTHMVVGTRLGVYSTLKVMHCPERVVQRKQSVVG